MGLGPGAIRNFRDRVVIVTGASSGIGRVTALRLAQQGARIVAVARREALLEQLLEDCRAHSPESFHLAGDLGDRSFAERIVHTTVERLGRLDVLINNHGVPLHKALFRISAEEAEETLRINFLSCVWTTFAAIPHMLVQGGGTLVNVASFAAKVAPTHETLYVASKTALSGFTEGLWNDLRGSGIHAILVHPGPIDTEIWDKLAEPGAYSGKRYPAEEVADGILEAIRQQRFEVVLPRRNPTLMLARFLRLVAPRLVRAGVARQDPVLPEHLSRALERARAGKPLGED